MREYLTKTFDDPIFSTYFGGKNREDLHLAVEWKHWL